MTSENSFIDHAHRKLVRTRFDGVNFSIGAVKECFTLLKNETLETLTRPCGHRIQAMVAPALSVNVTGLEIQQVVEEEKLKDENISDILSGHSLSEEAKKKLLKKPNEVAQALLKVFDYFFPVPCANITRHPQYRISVFCHLSDDDDDFKHLNFLKKESLKQQIGTQTLFQKNPNYTETFAQSRKSSEL